MFGRNRRLENEIDRLSRRLSELELEVFEAPKDNATFSKLQEVLYTSPSGNVRDTVVLLKKHKYGWTVCNNEGSIFFAKHSTLSTSNQF